MVASGKKKKKKKKIEVLRRAARKGNSQAGAITGKTRRSPMYEIHRIVGPDVATLAERDHSLHKTKGGAIRYPTSFVLTFRAYFKRVAHLERPYRDSPANCSLYDVYDARARYFYYYSRAYVCTLLH